jgi:hypothetical protein
LLQYRWSATKEMVRKMRDFSRQSFLGTESQIVLEGAKIALVGYGGGGSHFGQQFAHIGIGNFIVIDDDTIDDSNLHRFVGAEHDDVIQCRLKVDIAERQIKRGNPLAVVEKIPRKWQQSTSQLAQCDIVFGAVDSFLQRAELERFCRRNLIPYIDIGMDVREAGNGDYIMSGQVIQSLPGGHCMRCCNFITDRLLKREAEQYGDAGPKPQVIWPNGVLASTAVGFGVALLTPWAKQVQLFRWLSYDGNSGELRTPEIVASYLSGRVCPHHPAMEVGDPLADIRSMSESAVKSGPASFLKRFLCWLGAP